MPAAGLPWFMTIFGRDSIFTSLQALPFTPELAATTLRLLGLWQGTRVDDFRDEDPGRILHELRYGEMTAFEERPHSPYYGSADATPLYVVLLDEYERWTGDRKLVRDFEHEARAALGWIDEYADLHGYGYISYQRRNEQTGLENQCWKDSWDSISYRDGRLPGFPRATCELQGYAYDAKIRGARLARRVWHDPTFADRLEKEAAALSAVSTATSGSRTASTSPLALDADGRQVDSLTSNNGHLLWSGIVDKSKAKAVARHLMGAEAVFAAGACARWPRARDATTPSATTSAPSGPSTTRSSPGACAATASARGGTDRRRHPCRRRVLPRPPARGLRRLPARDHQIPGPVPDRLQPAGLVDRHATPLPPHDARPRVRRRAPRSSIPPCPTASAASSCSTSPGAGVAWTPSVAGGSTS